MKTNKAILSLSAFASLLLLSCKKEKETPGISYQVQASNTTTTVNGRIMAGSVNWTSGYASVRELEFEAKSKNVEIEYKTDVNQKINIFSSPSTLGMVTVPAGVYDDIEYEMEVRPNGADAAFQLNGTYTNARGVITPVRFTIQTDLEIEAEQENITIADGSTLTALTTLNLSLVTNGVTESMFDNAVLTNGVIEISKTSNDKLYQIMLHNLKGCGNVKVKD